MTHRHTIHQQHHGWDNSLPAVTRVAPGESLEFEVVDSSPGQLSRTVAAAAGAPSPRNTRAADTDDARLDTGLLLLCWTVTTTLPFYLTKRLQGPYQLARTPALHRRQRHCACCNTRLHAGGR
jgi:hypothetical protein